MTPEEKKAQRTLRDQAIVAYYNDGEHTLSECASRFKLNRQRVMQILKAADVWRPYVKTARTAFLGVQVSRETKAALQEQAGETSVSRYVSDKLDEMVNVTATATKGEAS